MIRLRSRMTKLAAIGATLTGLLAMSNAPALANEFGTGGNATSTINWTTGSTRYTQQHSGDDFAFTNDSGISVDMRWKKCDAATYGNIIYNISPGSGYHVLGTNFLAGSCLQIQYRGYTQTGSFNGTTFWNYNFA